MRMIVSADLHLREDRPRCRLDENWIETQRKALNQLYEYCVKKNCDLFLVGDIFHRSTEFRMVYYVQELAEKLLNHNLSIYYLCGNHDNLYHSTLNFNKSAIGLLKNSNNIFPISSYSDEISASNFDEETENKKIIFKHVLVFPDTKSLPPNVDAITAKELLSQYDKCQWAFTGDMHKNFHYEKNGRHVVNPGCLIREVSDMKGYSCGCYFIDTEKEIVEFLPIIDDEEFVDDSYILKEKEKEERIEKFADKLKETKNISLDFISNVEQSISENKISDELKETIEELLDI